MDESESFEKYMERALNLLSSYNWAHDFPVTKVFKNDVLSSIPKSWQAIYKQLSWSQINDLPFLTCTREQFPWWPDDFHDFLVTANSLAISREPSPINTPTAIETDMARGLSPKKLHEVALMSSFINKLVEDNACDVIVDVGSGLGYLDHVLHQVYAHKVIGLETNQSHTSAAEKRAMQQGLRCTGIQNINLTLSDSEQSLAEFSNTISELVPALECSCQAKTQRKNSLKTSKTTTEYPRICLVGLHCCGDLSPCLLKIYHKVQEVKVVCFVSCCYHKMRHEKNVFVNFPLSFAGQNIYKNFDKSNSFSLSPFTLRLGAQETRSRWKCQTKSDHEDHIRHVGFRGLLEIADCSDSESLRKNVRKCDFTSFDKFLESYLNTSTLLDSSLSSSKDFQESLRELYNKHKEEFDLLEFLTCIQVLLQPVIETLVYKDRLVWLRERGHTVSDIVPIFNEQISPRNLAIVSIKS